MCSGRIDAIRMIHDKRVDMFNAIFSHWDGHQTSTVRALVYISADRLIEHAPGTSRDGDPVGYLGHDGRWRNRHTNWGGHLSPVRKSKAIRPM